MFVWLRVVLVVERRPSQEYVEPGYVDLLRLRPSRLQQQDFPAVLLRQTTGQGRARRAGAD